MFAQQQFMSETVQKELRHWKFVYPWMRWEDGKSLFIFLVETHTKDTNWALGENTGNLHNTDQIRDDSDIYRVLNFNQLNWLLYYFSAHESMLLFQGKKRFFSEIEHN